MTLLHHNVNEHVMTLCDSQNPDHLPIFGKNHRRRSLQTAIKELHWMDQLKLHFKVLQTSETY